MKKGVLYILSGPSGVGKGTIKKEVLKDERFNLHFSVSCTTRAPREGEQHGVDYYFVSREKFDEMVADNQFLEHATFSGNSYGTPKFEVDNALNAGKNILLEIETQGALQVMKVYPDCCSIFILPPSIEVLRERLIGRGTEPIEVVEKRMSNVERELATAVEYKHQIVNDNLAKAVEDVKQVMLEAMNGECE